MRDAACQYPHRVQLARAQQLFFDLFSLLDFRSQPVVGFLLVGRAFGHALGQFVMRPFESLLAGSEGFFSHYLLRDVEPVTQHSRRRTRLVVTDVAVRPDSLRAVFRHQSHEAAVGSFGPDPLQVFIKQRANRGRQKLFQVPSHPFSRRVTQRSLHRGIKHQQHPVYVVDTHQPEALFNEQAIEDQLLLDGRRRCWHGPILGWRKYYVNTAGTALGFGGWLPTIVLQPAGVEYKVSTGGFSDPFRGNATIRKWCGARPPSASVLGGATLRKKRAGFA